MPCPWGDVRGWDNTGGCVFLDDEIEDEEREEERDDDEREEEVEGGEDGVLAGVAA